MPIISSLVEARSSLANPESWLLRAFNAHATSSGLDVNQDTALESSAVLDGVRLISQDVARVPLHVYRRIDDKRREMVGGHPVARVLADPNPLLIGMQFREMVTSFAVTAGAGYAQIMFNNGGEPAELWPIPPHRVTQRKTPSGVVVWEIMLEGGERRYLPLEEMLVVPGFTRDGIVGVDTFRKMREAIGLTMATELFGSSFFGNGANPGGAIQVPAVMSDAAYNRLKTSWEEKHRGIENSHKVALLEEGAQWVQMGVPNEASQFIETRKYQVTEVARALNVPPHKLKDLERATFSNIEEQNIDYFGGSLGPWYTRWEQAVAKRLLTPAERETLYLRHTVAALLRGDIKTRYEAYAIGRQNSWLSANDVRALEDMNPIEEDGGDDYHVQVNMVRVQDLDVEPVEPPISPEPDPAPSRSAGPRSCAYEPLVLDTAGRAVRREVGAMRKAMRSRGALDVPGFLASVDTFYEGHREWLTESFSPVFRSFAQVVQVGNVAMVDGFTDEFAARQCHDAVGQLKNTVRDTPAEEVEDALTALLDRWESTRANEITERECALVASTF